MNREAHEALKEFDDALESLVDEYLSRGATPNDVNEYYGYHAFHPVADILHELDEDRAKNESKQPNLSSLPAPLSDKERS